MKSLKRFLVIAAVLFMAPMLVCADDMPEANREKVNLYIFRGEGCPHCEEALEFIDGLDEEYKNYFNLVQYEVWYNSSNKTKMQKVANYFGDSLNGVPYIIVGNYRFTNGFGAASDGETLKEQIKTAYYDDNYEDLVAKALENKSDLGFIIVLSVVVIGGIAFVIFMSRDVEEKEESPKKETKKEVKSTKTLEVVAEKNEKGEPKSTSTKSTVKKSTTKKTNSKKKSSKK